MTDSMPEDHRVFETDRKITNKKAILLKLEDLFTAYQLENELLVGAKSILK